MQTTIQQRITGIIVGTAVADALGLPMEGLSPKRIERLGWVDSKKEIKHRFFFKLGMWSDDTEHTIMLTQALTSSHGDLDTFKRHFAWELRCWLPCLPAGVGLATAKAVIKLWLGFSPEKSGIFSAGNGSAMRTAPIAAYFPEDKKLRQQFTLAQSRMTHSDPKASIGALAVTELVAFFLNKDRYPTETEIIELLSSIIHIDYEGMQAVDQAVDDWKEIITLMQEAWNNSSSAADFLYSLTKKIGGNPQKGVTGYVYQSVPIAVYIGHQHQWDFKRVIPEIIRLGGDTDTVAAIAGAMCGAYGGIDSIPKKWKDGVKEWPCKIEDLERLATAIITKEPTRVRPRISVVQLIRNLFFLMIVLVHGFLRLIPR